MKKTIWLILLFIVSMQHHVLAQDAAVKESDFKHAISRLNYHIRLLNDANDSLRQINAADKKQLDDLSQQLSISQQNIKKIADSLHITITNVSTTSKQTNSQLENLNQSVSSGRLYWSIGILSLTLLSLVVYFTLQGKVRKSAQVLDSQITLTKHELERYVYEVEKQTITNDSKLIALLQTQLALIKEERAVRETETPLLMEMKPDHKLPLKVGEEIHRMRKRIENMDQDVKGLGALINSLKRLEEEFNDSGYEIENLMGKKYVDGMKMEARFVDNPDIPPGEERITDVLRPEIKYKGEVIQVAKVEVGKSY